METDQILDLFNLGDSSDGAGGGDFSGGGGAAVSDGAAGREEDMVDVTTGEVREKGKRGWLDGLGELWDERGYEEEYDLDNFLATMKV